MSVFSQRIRPVVSIAFNTYLEAARSKILYSILFFGVFLITFAAILGEVSLYQNERLIKDLGLFALSLFGNLMAIFLGASFVYKEIERKTIYNIVSKPIHRWHYFVGKYLGILLTLFIQLAIMLGVFVVVLQAWIGRIPINIFWAFLLTCVEVTIITTVALFFSSFSTPYLSGFLALGAYIAGKSGHLLQTAAEKASNLPALRFLIEAADRIIPSLYAFNISTEVTYDLPIPQGFLSAAIWYGLAYSLILLILGAVVFSRRDFM